MTPQQIGSAIGGILLLCVVVFVGFMGRHIVTTYNDALTDATKMTEDLRDAREKVQERDHAIEQWEEREKELLDLRAADAKALELKEAERKAALAKYDLLIGTFKNEMENLQGDDRFCAARTVPGAVDRLLKH